MSQIIEINSIDDTQLDVYRDLKKNNYTRWSNYFIAEGKWVVQRLIESDFDINSVLIAESKLERFLETSTRTDLKILCVADSIVNQLVGFEFHAGIMGCGVRTKRDEIDEAFWRATDASKRTVMACPETSLPDNLGSMIRLAAAFGCDAMVIGGQSADPFCRRCIRVSMGNIFSIPIFEPPDFGYALQKLRREFDFDIIATTLDCDADALEQCTRRRNTCLVFGNEAHGLRDEHYQLADRTVTLPMHGEIDSLNVSHSAAIFLYHYSRIATTKDDKLE